VANECIPLFRPGQDVTVLTTGAVTGRKFVDISATRDVTTGLIKVAAPSAAGKVFGVAATDIASGAKGAVIRGRGTILPVICGAGGVAAGVEVQVDATGGVITLASGVAVGRAVETGTATNPVLITLY